jgi:hypothetical protein
MEMRPVPFGKPRSLIKMNGDKFVLRMTSPTGERMATRLRAMRPRDAFTPPWFLRSR